MAERERDVADWRGRVTAVDYWLSHCVGGASEERSVLRWAELEGGAGVRPELIGETERNRETARTEEGRGRP